MEFGDYSELEAINWSTLRHLVFGSPLAYRHALTAPDFDTTGRLIGRAVHALVLEGREDYVIWDGDRRGKAWQEFRDQHAVRDILRASEADTVRAMAAAVAAHPRAVEALTGQREASRTWERGGRRCKGRLDVLGDGFVTDLKTCGPLSVLGRTAWSSGYVHQLAWYRHGAGVERAYIVGVEAKAPHDVGVWEVDRGALDVAGREIDAALARLAECEAADMWPGAMPDVGVMGLPAWVGRDDVDFDSLEVDDAG